MENRDGAAVDAGRAAAEESYRWERDEAVRAEMTGKAIAKAFGGSKLRSVVRRSPTHRDWRNFTDGADAELERLRAVEAERGSALPPGRDSNDHG